MDLSIIIPSYNERKRLPETLKAYTEFFDKRKLSYELIIADLSSDGTKEYVKSLKNHKIKYLEITKRGKGLAVYEGFKIAKGDLIGFTDADNSITPREFYKLYKQTKHYDGVIASRGLWREHAVNYQSSLLRRFFSFSLSLFFVRFLYGLRINDSQCGAKIFKREPLLKILPNLSLMNSYFDVELLYQFNKVGSIKEVPIRWVDKIGGHFSWKEILTGSWALFKTRFKQ